MKKIITITIMLLCMLTGGFCQNNDRTSNMRSSSTRSTVNNTNARNSNTRNAETTRSYGGGNMIRSGVTGGMRSGFTSSFSGNRNSFPQRRDYSANNDRSRNNNNRETQTNNRNN